MLLLSFLADLRELGMLTLESSWVMLRSSIDKCPLKEPLRFDGDLDVEIVVPLRLYIGISFQEKKFFYAERFPLETDLSFLLA